MTVRDMIRAIQKEVRDTDLPPDRSADLVSKLTALLGNVNDELRIADLEYKRVLLACMRASKAANRARIEAETSPEFVRWQEARHTKELAVEMIRSLRQVLRTAAEEMRLSR